MNITVLFEARYTCTYKFICLYNTLKSWLNIFIDRFWNIIAGNEESDEMISLHSNSCKSLEGKKKSETKKIKRKDISK